jgi:imidazolonepropionase-like amidohydrolase
MSRQSPVRTAALNAVVLLCLSAPARAAAPPPTAFALDHVAVVDVRTGDVARDRMVVVRAGHIAGVGAADTLAPPAGTMLLDAHGKFLIPGLWDMHVHIHDPAFLTLLVAEGVTGVREMGGVPATVRDWRERVASGRLLGPRIVMAGEIVDGPDPTWPAISRAVRTPEEGRAAVAASIRDGSDFIKVYNGLSRESYLAIVDEARQRHLDVVGHVPFAITAADAAEAGQRSIDHLSGVLEGCTSQPHPIAMGVDHAWHLAHFDARLADTLFATFVRDGTWHVPTLVVKRAFAHLPEYASGDDPRLDYIPSRIRAGWTNDRRVVGRRAPYFLQLEQVFERDCELVGRMHRAGVRFLAGTDLGNPFLYPGFSLHDELGLLVRSGLTPIEALQAATLGPAKFFSATDSLGTVEPGKVADLVLLDASPLDDIANVGKISAVCAHGSLLGRATLDKLLADVQAQAGAR